MGSWRSPRWRERGVENRPSDPLALRPAMNEIVNRALKAFARGHEPFRTVLADPPWRFQNRTGKMAPEHRRLSRYGTMTVEEVCALPVRQIAADKAHLYLWIPNALLAEGLRVIDAWGFEYKTNLVWYKTRKDGGPDGRGVGFYFRNVTELLLFGVRGKDNRTLAAGRTRVNLVAERKREHSRKPEQVYELIEACSPGPRFELFARCHRDGWSQWGDELGQYEPSRFSNSLYGVQHRAARIA
jgi:N6-adenosine-specific RNA methylase IME4